MSDPWLKYSNGEYALDKDGEKIQLSLFEDEEYPEQMAAIRRRSIKERIEFIQQLPGSPEVPEWLWQELRNAEMGISN